MCTSPLIRFRLKRGARGNDLFSNSSSFKIQSLRSLEELFASHSAFKSYFDEHCDYQYIKCRKCEECKFDYASEWGIRCAHEYQMSTCGAFITLTIDDTRAHLFNQEKNIKQYCKKCVKGNRYIRYPISYTLCKGLILDFVKKLRDLLYKRYGVSIRYFGCGEYGSNGDRPHYHILIYNYNFPDRQFIGYTKKGFPYYYSEELFNAWNYGICTVQDLDVKTCFYTAKYCLKKLKFTDDIQLQEQYYGREQEFLFMSKGNCQSNRCDFIDEIIKNCKGMKSLRDLTNPYCKFCSKTRGGIGYSWFLRYKDDVLKKGFITLDGIKYSIPKYYLSLLKLTDSEKYDNYKVRILNEIDKFEEIKPNDRSQQHLDVRKKINKARLKLSHRE